MEQLNDIILEIRAAAKEENGAVRPFHLQVFAPELDRDRGYYCRVICPYLRQDEFMIFGANEDQARELAMRFVSDCLDGRASIINSDGAELDLTASFA